MADHMQPHPKLGVNLRKALELCGICGIEYGAGMVPMGMQNFKYICPSCGLVHYGEPERDKDDMYTCSKCSEKNRAWKMIELKDNEPVKAGVGCCSGCRKKLGDSKYAFIEIVDGSDAQRTGNVYFVDPPEELIDQLGDARGIYMEQSMCRKIGLE